MSLLTNIVPLSSSGWLDLGAGPLTVAAYGPEWANAVLVASDTQPPLSLTEGEPLRGTRFFGVTTHIWGRALGPSARVVVTAPDIGAGSGGSGSGGATTIADGGSATLGSTTDAAWSGAGAGTLLAVAKATWNKLGALVFGAGEAHVGEVGGNIAKGQAQFGPASSTAYAAGQVMAAPIALALARKSNGSLVLAGATLALAALNTVEVDLVVFSALPAGTYTPGSAYPNVAADRPKIAAVLKVTDWTALSVTDSVGEAISSSKLFTCDDATATTTLWVVPVARGSITLASATDATITLCASRN